MSRRRQVPPPALNRQRFHATVYSEKAGRRVTVGRYAEKWRAERAAVCEALQPGFSHAQVHDTEEGQQ